MRNRNWIAVGLVVLTVVLHPYLLQTAYGWLVVDQSLTDCRFAVVVVPTPECYDEAVQLLNNGQVDEVLLPQQKARRSEILGANLTQVEIATLELKTRNVPTNQFRVIKTSASTPHQMFRELDRERSRDTNSKHLVISSSTLSGYYRQVIDQALPHRSDDYQLRSVMPKADDASSWWRTRRGVQRVMNHGLRLLFVLCHGESEVIPTDPYKHLVRPASVS